MLDKLKNKYFIMRHGESEANVKGILLSNPKDGTTSHGLTEKGKQQVKDSVTKSTLRKVHSADVIVYASDFLRTKETAELAAALLGVERVHLHEGLRERFFGIHDRQDYSGLWDVWRKDEQNQLDVESNVESPSDVLQRVLALIQEIEAKFEGMKILLVSHGDVLHILQAAFQKKSAHQHREIRHQETAEIRELR